MTGILKTAFTWALDLAPRPIRALWSNSAFNIWKIASVTAVATTIGIAIADRPEPPPPPVPEKPYLQESWKRDYPRQPEPAPQKEQVAQPAPVPPPKAELKPSAPPSLPAPVPVQVAPPPPAVEPVFQTRPALSAPKPKQSQMGNYNYVGQ